MQTALSQELGQKKRLAELGLAVAKINHDLRNMLTAAQLISDRLATIPDPLAMRLAPRLVATLDRAIAFCQETLTYGAAVEKAPQRRRIGLREVIQQAIEASGEREADGGVSFDIDVPEAFEIFADPEHVLRVIENLNRNAIQALAQFGPSSGRPSAIRYAATRANGAALIEVCDTGPGFPAASGAPHFRAVSSVDPGGRLRPRPGDRRRSDRPQRRLDRAGAAPAR